MSTYAEYKRQMARWVEGLKSPSQDTSELSPAVRSAITLHNDHFDRPSRLEHDPKS